MNYTVFEPLPAFWLEMNSDTPVKFDAKFGAWEKHTKGVGLKLLQKFGFKGRLGLNETGIATAVEATVRTPGVGLGLASNESGGVKEVKKEATNKVKSANTNEQISSLNSWKKKASKDKKKDFEDILSNLLNKTPISEEKSNINIIDMRSEQTRIITDGSDIDQNVNIGTQTKYGEELLYNLDKMHKSIVATQAHHELELENVYDSTIASLELDLLEITKEMQTEADRISHMKIVNDYLMELNENARVLTEPLEEVWSQLLEALDHASDSVNAVDTTEGLVINYAQRFKDDVHNIVSKIASVCVEFPRESTDCQLDRVYVDMFGEFMSSRHLKVYFKSVPVCFYPSLISVIFLPWWSILDKLSAFESLHVDESVEYVLVRLSKSIEIGLQSWVLTNFLPVVKRSLMNDWKVVGCESKLDRLTSIVSFVQNLQLLLDRTNYVEFCVESVFAKLLHHLHNGASSLKEKNSQEQMHLWLKPWIVVFQHNWLVEYNMANTKTPSNKECGSSAAHNMVVGLFPEVRRRLRHLISKRHITREASHIQSLLQPWEGLFDAFSMHQLVLHAVVPRLAQTMRTDFRVNPSAQSLELLWSVVSYANGTVLSPSAIETATATANVVGNVVPIQYIVFILEGELFPQWLHVLIQWIEQQYSCLRSTTNPSSLNTQVVHEMMAWYMGWRNLFQADFLNACEPIMQYFSKGLDCIKMFGSLLMRKKRELQDSLGTESALYAEHAGQLRLGGNAPGTVIDDNSIDQNRSLDSDLVHVSGWTESFPLSSDIKTMSNIHSHSYTRVLRENEVEKSRVSYSGNTVRFAPVAEGLISESHTQTASIKMPAKSMKYIEVVEELVVECNCVFAPHKALMINNKQVYRISKEYEGYLCYVDSNVCYVQKQRKSRRTGESAPDPDTEWNPVSLGELKEILLSL